MEMTVDRAVEVLDLKFDFNAEELKNSYRIMSKKYHPDNISTGNTEKMQEVNEAYWYLVSYLSKTASYNRNTSNTSSPSFDVASYKREKIEWLEKKVKFDFEKYNDIPDNIEKLLRNVQADVKAYKIQWKFVSNKSKIDDDINLVILPKLKEVLRNIKNEFYFEFEIIDPRMRRSLNYDDDLETFYDNLIRIKRDNDRMMERDTKNRFIKEIDREITLFRYRHEYGRLAKMICKVRSSYIDKIRKSATIDLSVKDFREAILNIFDVMEDYDLKIFELKSICYHINDDKIRKKLEKLLNNFECIENFSVLDRDISELEKLIEEYKYEQNKLKISEYYEMILNRYINSLQQLRGQQYLKDAALVNYIFQMSIGLMQDVENGKRDIVDLELLARITFSNYKQDLEVLSKGFSDSFSNIYVINRKIDDNDDNTIINRKISEYFEKEVKVYKKCRK